MEIKNEAESYYMNLFRDDHQDMPLFEGLKFYRISGPEKIWVERQFSEEEVHNTIRSMKGDKAPSPNSFSISFIRRCWDIVNGDLLQVMNEFYYSEEFYEHLNNTFITLIPKKRVVKELKDFRLISLLNSVYKIIFKMSIRLKMVLKNIISPP